MCKSMFVLFSASILVLWSSLSPAASVSLMPSSSTVSSGDTFTVDLVLDATDLYSLPWAYTGEVLIDYDPEQLDFLGFNEAVTGTTSPLAITMDPTTLGPLNNGRDKFALLFGNLTFSPPNVGTIGTYSFRAKDMISTALIDIADFSPAGSIGIQNDPSSGSSASFFSSFPAQFNNTAVEVIPVPAAVWLMLSGLGMFGFISRRS